MIRRSFRFGLTLGLVAGVAFALVKMFGSRAEPAAVRAPEPPSPWPRLEDDPTVAATPRVELRPDPAAARPAPTPAHMAAPKPPAPEPPAPKPAPVAAKKAPAKKKPLAALWVEPKAGVCPTSHPVKAKLSSKIFHLPGMLNYERTNPDRCYRDEKAAEGDGLRAAKR